VVEVPAGPVSDHEKLTILRELYHRAEARAAKGDEEAKSMVPRLQIMLSKAGDLTTAAAQRGTGDGTLINQAVPGMSGPSWTERGEKAHEGIHTSITDQALDADGLGDGKRHGTHTAHSGTSNPIPIEGQIRQKPQWKVERDERERKAKEEGRGYWDLMVEQVWDVWQGVEGKAKDIKKIDEEVLANRVVPKGTTVLPSTEDK
jgi:hypothetical protein